MHRTWLIAAALVAPTPIYAQATHGVTDPRAFVAEMLGAYARSPNNPPPEPVHAYSARLISLFTVYQVWQRAHEDLVGSLDFDWWVNAQDWTITGVRVTEAGARPTRRVITARWSNYDRADSSRFVFIRERGRWVLDDVINGAGYGDNGWTLSQLLRQRP